MEQKKGAPMLRIHMGNFGQNHKLNAEGPAAEMK